MVAIYVYLFWKGVCDVLQSVNPALSKGFLCFLLAGLCPLSARADTVYEYADFHADSVSFLQVVETSQSGPAHFGAPLRPVVNDTLTFSPTGAFRAESPYDGQTAQAASSRLAFTLDAGTDRLTELRIRAGGDFGWTALPGGTADIAASFRIEVFDLDGQSLLLSDQIPFSEELDLSDSPTVFVADWDLEAELDLSGLNRQRVLISVVGHLDAAVGGPATAFIEAKNLTLGASVGQPNLIPTPSACLTGLALMGLLVARRGRCR